MTSVLLLVHHVVLHLVLEKDNQLLEGWGPVLDLIDTIGCLTVSMVGIWLELPIQILLLANLTLAMTDQSVTLRILFEFRIDICGFFQILPFIRCVVVAREYGPDFAGPRLNLIRWPLLLWFFVTTDCPFTLWRTYEMSHFISVQAAGLRRGHILERKFITDGWRPQLASHFRDRLIRLLSACLYRALIVTLVLK